MQPVTVSPILRKYDVSHMSKLSLMMHLVDSTEYLDADVTEYLDADVHYQLTRVTKPLLRHLANSFRHKQCDFNVNFYG